MKTNERNLGGYLPMHSIKLLPRLPNLVILSCIYEEVMGKGTIVYLLLAITSLEPMMSLNNIKMQIFVLIER